MSFPLGDPLGLVGSMAALPQQNCESRMPELLSLTDLIFHLRSADNRENGPVLSAPNL